MLLGTVLVFIGLYHTNLILACCKSYKRLLRNHQANSIPLISNVVESRHKCIEGCYGVDTCKAFSFKETTKQCALYEVSHLFSLTGSTGTDIFMQTDIQVCPSGWIWRQGTPNCYLFSTASYNQTVAADNCFNNSGYMTDIVDQGEQDYLAKMLTEKNTADGWWIGIHKTDYGAFKLYTESSSVTKPPSFFSWGPGNPDGGWGVIMSRNFMYKWDSKKWLNSYPFICKKVSVAQYKHIGVPAHTKI